MDEILFKKYMIFTPLNRFFCLTDFYDKCFEIRMVKDVRYYTPLTPLQLYLVYRCDLKGFRRRNTYTSLDRAIFLDDDGCDSL